MYEAASTCYVDLAVISLNLDNVLEVPGGVTVAWATPVHFEVSHAGLMMWTTKVQ